MKKITLLCAAMMALAFNCQLSAQSLINITTSGGSFTTEKWVSVTTEANGGGTQVFGQGNGTYGNGAGLINQNISLAPGTYYVNCYDKYADGWDGTLISVTSFGDVLADNGGDSPDDGTDTDASSAFGDTQAQELEASLMIVVLDAPCSTPTVTFNVVTECPTGTGFSVSVNITDIGTASGVTISDDQSTTPLTGLTAGTYSFGTYAGGTTVVLNVVNDDNAICTLNSSALTFSGVCPPDNDDCANATMLTAGADLNCDNPVSGTTAGATESLPGCVGTANDDVWYSFVATGTQNSIIITNTAGSTDIVTEVFDACGGTSLKCQDTPNSPVSLEGLTLGNTYYFRIYTYSSDPATITSFEVCVGTPPAPPVNDDCNSAFVLTPGLTYSSNPLDGTVVSATLGSETNDCSGFGQGPGVWYSVLVPNDGNITIETGPDAATSNTGFDSQIEVFSGTCDALVSIDCDDDGAATGAYSLLNLTGLEGGSTIFVRVWEYGGDETEPFSISAYSPTLSIGDVDSVNAFSYFPNPVTNTLNLKAQSTIQNVSVYNMLGQEVSKSAPNTLNSEVDMSSLQTGAYFVKVTINDATETIRVIKQ